VQVVKKIKVRSFELSAVMLIFMSAFVNSHSFVTVSALSKDIKRHRIISLSTEDCDLDIDRMDIAQELRLPLKMTIRLELHCVMN